MVTILGKLNVEYEITEIQISRMYFLLIFARFGYNENVERGRGKTINILCLLIYVIVALDSTEK